MKPILSVIIPTYHRNDLLKACLDCLLPDIQTIHPDKYEVIVTDDGRESTAQQLISNQYPRVRWIKGPQRGPAANRNNGAKEALGQWLVFTDDDCLPTANWLDSYYQATQTNSAINVFEGRTLADRQKMRYDEEAPINEKGGNLWSCNFCISNNAFVVINGFDEQFPYAAMEDIDLCTRLNIKLISQSFVKEALVIHPLRRTSSNKYDQVFKSYQYFIGKHTQINMKFRLNRLKTLIYSCLFQGKDLVKFKFRGWQAFREEHIFILKTVFSSYK